MNAPITIRALFFARLAEIAGARELSLEVPAGSSVGDAITILVTRFPALAASKDSLAPAVNQSYARRSDALSDGDVLALIPPVSGG